MADSSDAELEVLQPPNFEGDDRYVYGYTLRRPEALDEEETAVHTLKMYQLTILATKKLGMQTMHPTPVFYIAAWSPVHQEVLSIWTADNRIPGPKDRAEIQDQLGDEWEGPLWIKADEKVFWEKNAWVDWLFAARFNRKDHRRLTLKEALGMYKPPLPPVSVKVPFVGAKDPNFRSNLFV
ncbi:hypothetical protein MKEN_01429500 [Mycena kentingensis (nom. inval.)]|nr:hypothetical protein MKEN_01429500 [Mycena kentingensis (nom. inval.)]